jgi:hypothetical protein
MKIIALIAIAASLLPAPAFAASPAADGPPAGTTIGGKTSGTSDAAPGTSGGAGSGASETASSPTAPQGQGNFSKGEAASQRNDPGTRTSPSSPQSK